MLSPVRRALVRQVRATFNDQSKGEKPVPASDQALFPPGSVIRRVHGDVTSMMVGGIAALLTQMLHPKALAGVWDHSDVHADMLGRLRRTARFIAVTTFGHRDKAEAAIARVRAIHEQVRGSLPDGSEYRATDPGLLAWVHVAGAVNFLDGWRRYAEPAMSVVDQDRYFAESGEIAGPDRHPAAARLRRSRRNSGPGRRGSSAARRSAASHRGNSPHRRHEPTREATELWRDIPSRPEACRSPAREWP